ncbi:hypothetical protein KOW79_003640 [Hemibagrus wyckioides]|uniref:Uncharacterized protein n=1 Tax=Hemibagrus wyckioides TaxID=337641 RepID=A0A9D3P2K2_9TELE|nr:hypothetical protein KOW79_003640 [Hemibagrus wyckioides]
MFCKTISLRRKPKSEGLTTPSVHAGHSATVRPLQKIRPQPTKSASCTTGDLRISGRRRRVIPRGTPRAAWLGKYELCQSRGYSFSILRLGRLQWLPVARLPHDGTLHTEGYPRCGMQDTLHGKQRTHGSQNCHRQPETDFPLQKRLQHSCRWITLDFSALSIYLPQVLLLPMQWGLEDDIVSASSSKLDLFIVSLLFVLPVFPSLSRVWCCDYSPYGG